MMVKENKNGYQLHIDGPRGNRWIDISAPGGAVVLSTFSGEKYARFETVAAAKREGLYLLRQFS